jgi:hypothetical protein
LGALALALPLAAAAATPPAATALDVAIRIAQLHARAVLEAELALRDNEFSRLDALFDDDVVPDALADGNGTLFDRHRGRAGRRVGRTPSIPGWRCARRRPCLRLPPTLSSAAAAALVDHEDELTVLPGLDGLLRHDGRLR